MSTTIRPEVKASNKYYISKHRFYELKHFCLQYPEWKENLDSLTILRGQSYEFSAKTEKDSETEKIAIKIASLRSKMEQVEQAAIASDADIYPFIFKSVTEGISYEKLIAHGIPCGRDYFYDRFRRFFWILDGYHDILPSYYRECAGM